MTNVLFSKISMHLWWMVNGNTQLQRKAKRLKFPRGKGSPDEIITIFLRIMQNLQCEHCTHIKKIIFLFDVIKQRQGTEILYVMT